MTPYYADDWLTVYAGDCRAVLATLPAESVHCVVTSPPYWGLRDYGTASWEGGDMECLHARKPGGTGGDPKYGPNKGQAGGAPTPMGQTCIYCGATRIDNQLGLEPTPEQYVANMVAVFREVRRVLRNDGTLWLNLGDSYAVNGGARAYGSTDGAVGRGDAPGGLRTAPAGLKPKDLVGIPWRVAFALQADGWYLRSDIIWAKPNPMPESVTDRPTKSHEYVFLLARGEWKSRVVHQADGNGEGLHLHSDFWPTSAPVRLPDADFGVRLASAILDSPEGKQQLGLTALDPQIGQESARNAYRDAIGRLPAVEGPAMLAARLLTAQASPKEFFQQLHRRGLHLTERGNLLVDGLESEVALPPGVTTYGEAAIAIHYPGEVRQLKLSHNQIIASTPSTCTYYFDADAVREDGAGRLDRGNANIGARLDSGAPWRNEPLTEAAGRNIRSVWQIATQPYPGAHFATFPPKLVEPCIKAGTSERGVCAECGAPWRRVVEREGGERYATGKSAAKNSVGLATAFSGYTDGSSAPTFITLGWQPSCAHTGEPVPATTCDPFAGSGTTGMVAQSLSRRAILIDLNPAYLMQAMERNADIPLGLVG